jgi:hypothetical protein
VDFDIQYNVSDFDANTLSGIGDEDNVGDAGEAKLRVKDIPVGIGKLELDGSVSTVLDRYRSFEKTRTWYYYRDWNLESEPLVGREIVEEVGAALVRSERLKLSYRLGGIDRDNFEGLKHEAQAKVSLAPDRSATARFLSTDVDGASEKRTRSYGGVTLAYGVWKFVPSAEYSAEEYLVTSPVLPDSGISYDRYAVRLSNRGDGGFTYSVYGEKRDTEQLADTTNGWVFARTDQTIGGTVASPCNGSRVRSFTPIGSATTGSEGEARLRTSPVSTGSFAPTARAYGRRWSTRSVRARAARRTNP